MIDTGNYQNEIAVLPVLEVRQYERIFKIFKESVNNKDFYTYNILNKIEFPEIDSSHVRFYTPRKRMALTILSYNIYDDMKSWWILYLMNKDVFKDAPFYVEGGVQIKYMEDSLRSFVYDDITRATVFGGRHY